LVNNNKKIGKIMKLKIVIIGLIFINSLNIISQEADSLSIEMIQGEYWWGGLSAVGHNTPYDMKSIVTHNLWGNNKGNQAQPLLLSSKGRFIWSEHPIKYSFHNGDIKVTTQEGKIVFGSSGKNLQDAYQHAVKNFFPPNGKIPEPKLFTHP